MIVSPLAIHPLIHVCEHMRPADAESILVTRPGVSLLDWANEQVDASGEHFLLSTDEGEPVAACGFTFTSIRHVVCTWLVATKRLEAIGKDLHRFALRTHAAMVLDGTRRFETLNLHQHSRCGSVQRLWLDRLGYQVEGIHRNRGVNGETLVAFARLEGG